MSSVTKKFRNRKWKTGYTKDCEIELKDQERLWKMEMEIEIYSNASETLFNTLWQFGIENEAKLILRFINITEITNYDSYMKIALVSIMRYYSKLHKLHSMAKEN